MRALLLDAPGSPLDLRKGDVPKPTPGPGEILVRVEAVGLNPVDAKLIARGNPNWSWPHVPGIDFAGVIVEMGPDVDPLRHDIGNVSIGDRVAAHGFLERDGALADFVVADALSVAVVPDAVDAVTATALPCAGMTAYQSVVDRLHVTGGDTVLVLAGGGAVGGFAVQLAHAAGAHVIATASEVDRDRVLALGADDVIDHHYESVADRVLQITGGRGVDGIVDVLPTPSATNGLRLLAHGGGIACVGDIADVAAIPGFGIAPSIHEVALGAAHANGDPRARRRLSTMLTAMLDQVAAGTLDPLLQRVVPFDEAPSALHAVGQGRAHGKWVVAID